jgi:1-aminocyclopropane-1-carboxylate deaminase
MQGINPDKISIDKLTLPILKKNSVETLVLRLDKIHSLISGNKWFKLRYYLEDARKLKKKTIVTFGGAWSNHIHATAAACKLIGLNSIGIIRGEEAAALSSTLINARQLGMKLIFINRTDYHNKNFPPLINNEDFYIINEGGFGEKGVAGAATILDHCNKMDYTHICCAAGTGTMTAGLIRSAALSNIIVSISVLKNNYHLNDDVKSLSGITEIKIALIHDYHFGGYAKHKPELFFFMNDLYKQSGIPTDFVYTGKLFFGVSDLLEKDFFPPGSRILIIHSGGLQGNESLGNGTLIF